MTPPARAITLIGASRAAVTALFFANGFGYGTWVAHLPLFKARLGLSDGLLGTALLFGAVASLVAMPVIGAAIARFGSRGAATVGSLGASALLVLPFLATSTPAFVLAIIVISSLYSAMDVSMNAQAVVVEGSGRRPIMSSFHAIFSLGGLAGSLVSALLIARGFGLETDGAIVAAGCCALVVAALPFLAREPRRVPAAAEGTRRPAFGSVALLGMLAFLGLVGEGAMADWSGIYLHSSLAANAAASAAAFGAFSVAMALGRGLGDGAVARVGSSRTLVAGSMLASSALAATLLLHTLWSAYLGFALVGLGLANVIPIAFSAVGRERSLAPGVGIASVSTLGYAGFLVGPPAIGFTSDALGIRTALIFVVVCVATIALVARKALAPRAEQRMPAL